MPLSKERMREYMKQKRLIVIPKPKDVIPNRYLAAHMAVYPQGFNPDGSYRADYDPRLDPAINPLLTPPEPLPNSPDGRYHAPQTTI